MTPPLTPPPTPPPTPPMTTRDFVILSALVVPSEAAAPSASLEWRAVRAAWLAALSAHGLSEEQARRLASAQRVLALRALTGPVEDPSKPPFSTGPQSPQETGL